MTSGRIAIPSEEKGGMDGTRSGHFGHCKAFTLVDVKDGKITGISTIPNQEHREGGCMVPVNLLAEQKVNAIIVSGMGLRPLLGFNQVGIEVYYETKRPFIKPVVEDLIAGNLELMTNNKVCGGGQH